MNNDFNFKSAGPDSTQNKISIFSVLYKVLTIVVLGFCYFFIIGMSVMTTDSCSNDCKFLETGLIVGFILMAISFAYVTLSIIKSKRSHGYFAVLMPYVAVPVFFAIIISSASLESYLKEKNLEQQVTTLPIHQQTETNGETINWVTYTDTKYGFSIDYPTILKSYDYIGFKGYWIASTYNSTSTGRRLYDRVISFGPGYNQAAWNMKIVDKNSMESIRKSVDEIINNDRETCQWMKCTEVRKNILINDYPALFVSHPTDNDKDHNTVIYIENNDYIFLITGFIWPEFETFYNSFIFTT